ncbi:tellurite resistance TerB family protein [Cellvibrio japonicus]|uniref:Co-chaperone DjlA N-terminal domain-containing protein n=1 Tax=Cellvibrio japonicus (strain Ueda107) TaxID=498211 RepID=B3PDM8_CELJU|nr:TerB family tellurite resistance protein [Cellvibrio japonicus]ACE85045.1 conserved hypothetical protein [Cellvibrio japonicus Ueda107]QEI12037.1 TerB family tellurite resistance protein [Cellvibrio japonicus]QEI15612.1 TerB family tellurite resistance protein [Cellvibrio japonicus]QEI19190.1 TerB family tellurite resistance protein [Cellvibrio japonicus]
MLSKLARFIERHLQTGDAGLGLDQHQKQLACAALLVEVAMADHHFSPEEHQQLRQSLQQKFLLPSQTLDELIEAAEQESADAASLHQFTQLVNTYCSSAEKFALVKAMWELALSDGNLDKYEEHTIRKVADLIYVPHTEFIRAKTLAREQHR